MKGKRYLSAEELVAISKSSSAVCLTHAAPQLPWRAPGTCGHRSLCVCIPSTPPIRTDWSCQPCAQKCRAEPTDQPLGASIGTVQTGFRGRLTAAPRSQEHPLPALRGNSSEEHLPGARLLHRVLLAPFPVPWRKPPQLSTRRLAGDTQCPSIFSQTMHCPLPSEHLPPLPCSPNNPHMGLFLS